MPIGTILSLISGLVSLFNKLAGLFRDAQERKAGAAEAEVAGQDEINAELSKARRAGDSVLRDIAAHGSMQPDTETRH
jgi:hypothetical protein